jgi:hypothetical protein
MNSYPSFSSPMLVKDHCVVSRKISYTKTHQHYFGTYRLGYTVATTPPKSQQLGGTELISCSEHKSSTRSLGTLFHIATPHHMPSLYTAGEEWAGEHWYLLPELII